MLINCSPDRSPSRQSSSSGDLLLEMMERETPPPDTLPPKVGAPEVLSWRISLDPPRPEDNPLATQNPQYLASKESGSKGLELYNVWSDVLKDLLGQAAISEAHCTLMSMVIERISSAKSGLHEAFMSLLKGFEVREIVCVFIVPHMLGVPYVDSSP